MNSNDTCAAQTGCFCDGDVCGGSRAAGEIRGGSDAGVVSPELSFDWILLWFCSKVRVQGRLLAEKLAGEISS